MPKRIVICSDGTWFTPEHKHKGVLTPSNVYKLACAIAPRAADGTEQVVFYDKGVGAGRGLNRLFGGAFGAGLFKNIEDAYSFIVHNYAEGDAVYFFGFSRGAYTVRSTVGLIRKCGLLKKIHADRFSAAYNLYRRRDLTPDTPEAKTFREDYAREIRIQFLGVWETVGALGIPFGFLGRLTRRRYQFHDVRLSRIVDYAYHAVAIDEQRRPFAPTLWEVPDSGSQHVEQVWFAGVHNNVGGGYRDHRLSDVAFVWLQEKAAACGLEFDNTYIQKTITPDYAGESFRSKTLLFYRLLGAAQLRAIAQHGGTSESIHDSARRRFEDERLSYKPANLADYFKQHGSPYK